MKIKKISYSQYLKTDDKWFFNDFEYANINLIVGKNATGKSRSLSTINSLARFLSEPTSAVRIANGTWDIYFDNNDSEVHYILDIQNSIVLQEELIIDGTQLLIRDDTGEGKIFFNEEKKHIRFKISPNEVAAYAKRDEIQHTFLEALFEWASSLIFFQFGSSMGQNKIIVEAEQQTDKKLNIKDSDGASEKFASGLREFGETYNEQVLHDIRQLGFNIKNIELEEFQGIQVGKNPLPGKPFGIVIEENDTNAKSNQLEISQGMFRALSLILQINYLIFADKLKCILIDDIGEGLDYERAASIIELVMDKAIKHNAQLRKSVV